jgi:hypothetical protein
VVSWQAPGGTTLASTSLLSVLTADNSATTLPFVDHHDVLSPRK